MLSPKNILLIIPNSKACENLAEQIAERVFIRVINHFEKELGTVPNEERWLRLDEAKKILPFSSKKKWKALRDNLEIQFTQPGREFLYLRSSLLNYLKNYSTIKNQKSTKY